MHPVMISVKISANVYDGTLNIEATGDVEYYENLRVEPWGVDETGMERADAALTDAGIRRTSDWETDAAGVLAEYPTCTGELPGRSR